MQVLVSVSRIGHFKVLGSSLPVCLQALFLFPKYFSAVWHEEDTRRSHSCSDLLIEIAKLFFSVELFNKLINTAFFPQNCKKEQMFSEFKLIFWNYSLQDLFKIHIKLRYFLVIPRPISNNINL